MQGRRQPTVWARWVAAGDLVTTAMSLQFRAMAIQGPKWTSKWEREGEPASVAVWLQ